jgi:hypothetical protein
VARGEPSSIVDVVCMPDSAAGGLGSGTVHHIAWRTPDDSQQREWHTEIARQGYNISPIMDRKYFHSIYFREPGGVLFEIATDHPGFAVDEPAANLGTKLVLPDWLETRRSQIEARLPPLNSQSGCREVCMTEAALASYTGLFRRSLRLCHTVGASRDGGDENDLLPLGQALVPGARYSVLEEKYWRMACHAFSAAGHGGV